MASKYQRLRGAPLPAVPGPEGVAALWLDQLCRQPLALADGGTVTVVQPGLPEAPGSPFLADAALRFGDGAARVGTVAVGAAPGAALLRVEWEAPARPLGPTVALRDQLLGPWEEVADLLDLPAPPPGPAVLREEAPVPAERRAELARAAGEYRLDRKARRLAWREKAVGRLQLLWEEAAGALGFHRNQAPFRHLARRLPVSFLRALPEGDAEALLFGVAGLLPAENLAGLAPDAREAARALWERWWKARGGLDYAVLPAAAWTRARIRPANAPERRLAALARLLPHLERLDRAVARREPAAFARVLAEGHDPFWNRRAGWKGRPFAKPVQLVGAERIDDLTANLFWPLVALDDPAAARAGLAASRAGGSRAERDAWRRLFGEAAPGKGTRSALVRQGLLQLRRDAPDAAALGRLLAAW